MDVIDEWAKCINCKIYKVAQLVSLWIHSVARIIDLVIDGLWAMFRESSDSANTGSPQHKHWPTGPAHFSDRRASTGQYIVSFTGPAGPPS